MAQERENAGTGGPNDPDAGGAGADEREQVWRETREASMRAEGGGSSDEDDIREAARGDRPAG